jgi:hypothetical protein
MKHVQELFTTTTCLRLFRKSEYLWLLSSFLSKAKLDRQRKCSSENTTAFIFVQNVGSRLLVAVQVVSADRCVPIPMNYESSLHNATDITLLEHFQKNSEVSLRKLFVS